MLLSQGKTLPSVIQGALVPVSCDDRHFSGPLQQGRLAPAPTTCLPSQLLLLGCWKAQGTQGRQDPCQGNRGISSLLCLTPRRLSGWRVPPKLAACGSALLGCLLCLSLHVAHIPPHFTLLCAAPDAVPVPLSPFSSSEAHRWATRQLAGEPCRQQESWGLPSTRKG